MKVARQQTCSTHLVSRRLAIIVAVVTLLVATTVDGHGMHAMHAAAGSSPSTTDYKCPACRMSTMKNNYNNKNYIELENGQRVYSCGMNPRPFPGYDFSSSDTAYIGANMAEFIVPKSDEENYDCDESCPECANGDVRDPIDGTTVTTDNFKLICLVNGQKIFFASLKTRNAYLDKVSSSPRVSVQSMKCKDESCSDESKITTVSAAAKSFDPSAVKKDYPSDEAGNGSPEAGATPNEAPVATSAATTAPTQAPAPISGDATTGESDTHEDHDGFCAGAGSVMFNGFSSTINGSCVRLFFRPWVLNSAFKYILGFFACMIIAMFNEFLVKTREWMRKTLLVARRERPTDVRHKWLCKALLALMYMLQMTVAYFAMLVVMIYETGLFIALILGFGAGFVLFKDFDVDVTDERGVWRYTDPSVVRIRVEGMSCMKNCGTTVENALMSTAGVSKAFVDFDEKCAYVAGSASFETLVEAIEAVGFTARLDQNNTYRTPSNV